MDRMDVNIWYKQSSKKDKSQMNELSFICN